MSSREETREVTREEADQVDKRLDAPGRGGRNTSQHEGHVRLEQVHVREDVYRVDRILLTGWKTKDEQQSGWARHGRRNQGGHP
jgi:hypothetical protein